jgi:hypothetical protein
MCACAAGEDPSVARVAAEAPERDSPAIWSVDHGHASHGPLGKVLICSCERLAVTSSVPRDVPQAVIEPGSRCYGVRQSRWPPDRVSAGPGAILAAGGR